MTPTYCTLYSSSYTADLDGVVGQYSELITLDQQTGVFTFFHTLTDTLVGTYVLTVTVEVGGAVKTTETFQFNLVVQNPCPQMVITYPDVAD